MNIALIAHDEMKDTMIGFCIAYERILKNYGLYGTGTTGKRIMDETSLDVNRLASGPLGRSTNRIFNSVSRYRFSYIFKRPTYISSS